MSEGRPRTQSASRLLLPSTTSAASLLTLPHNAEPTVNAATASATFARDPDTTVHRTRAQSHASTQYDKRTLVDVADSLTPPVSVDALAVETGTPQTNIFGAGPSPLPIDDDGEDGNGLVSPSGIISESAFSATVLSPPVSSENDSGMGPGRIRQYAHEEPTSASWKAHKKHFFILSAAGKPIYARYGNEDQLAPLMAVIQVMISFYSDTDDTLRCVHAGEYVIVFLIKSPLYFVVVSRTGESEHALREQLQWLHYQIISITTASQLARIFDEHKNFDLRRLLGGTESFLDHLCRTVGTEPGYFLGAIHCVRMVSSLRQAVGAALQVARNKAPESLLYGLLIVGKRLVTILRPKRHSFHPSDLHLIFNMVNSSTSFKSAPESWMPICLPKFNDRGFVHAYVSYITPQYPAPASDLCLVLVSPDRDKFFEMSECRQLVVQHMTQSGALFLLQESIRKSDYTMDDVGIPGLRHFLYKSKSHIQFTMPSFGDPYRDKPKEQKRVFRLYQMVKTQMQQRARPLKLELFVGPNESIFAWSTSKYELMAVFGPLVTKTNAVHAMNAVLRWIQKDEDRLFIANAPTF